MKKIIFILLALISVYSCQRKTYCERKAQKVARILKDCPNIIDTTRIIDTVVIRDTFSLSIPAKIDTGTIDSLLAEYCKGVSNEVKDTVKVRIIKERIYSQCTPDKVIGSGERLLINGKDTVIVSYTGTKTGLDLSIISMSKRISETRVIVTPCPETRAIDAFKDYWWLLLLMFVMGLLFGVYKR